MSYIKQVKTVFLIETAIILVLGGFAYIFWTNMCGSNGWASCLGDSSTAPIWFVVYSIIRPILATPIMIIALIAGDAFGPFWGTILSAMGITISCMVLYLPAKYIGKIYVKPFLSANLPAMWRLMRTQDFKVVCITRWIPFFPFDLLSIVFGVADFRFKSVLIGSFIGVLPECYMFAHISGEPTASAIQSVIYSLTVMSGAILVPLLFYEIISRKRGSSLWNRLRGVYRELVFEIRANNEIVRRNTYDSNKIPVILVYGFFSSRRALAVLERILQARGFQVMSFNLGGMFGVFFTKGIRETAAFIDKKIRSQCKRHGFKKVHIVSHSKGGLVAAHWLLKLGGHNYCDKLITMGTPFKGTIYTYLALSTPLGFIWRDVWQMRPGSEFLKELHDLELPENTKIYNFYSEKDKVATGEKALFETAHNNGSIIPVPMHHVSHFEFLYRRDVGDTITAILRDEFHSQKATRTEQASSDL